MKLRLDSPRTRTPSPWELYSLLVLVVAAVLIPLSYVYPLPEIHSPLRYTGFACPLCGGTRSVTALFVGEVALAFRYNPLAPFILVIFVYSAASWTLLVLPFRRRIVADMSRNQRTAFWLLVAALLVANWVYVAWAQMYKVPLEL